MNYKLLYPLFYLLSLLPFWALYLLSDFAYIIIYKIVGYRSRVVRNNLRTSLAENRDAELTTI